MIRGNLAIEAIAERNFATAERELEALLEQTMTRRTWAWCAANLGCLRLIAGKHDEAHALVLQAVPIMWEEQSEYLAFCLEILAAIVVEDDPRKSARLLALAAAWWDSQGIAVVNREAYELELTERTQARSLRLLGADAFAAEQAAGRALLPDFRRDMTHIAI